MGLDMYLKKKIYIGAQWEHRKVTGKIDIKIDGKPVNVNFNKVSYIEEEVAYWRKANAIHEWFVRNCQDGEDDCREAYVSEKQLKELLLICKKIKEEAVLVDGMVYNGTSYKNGVSERIYQEGKTIVNKEICEELLPTTSGFFFGSTEYDEYYMDDINHTIETLEEVLSDNSDKEFYYTSSW